MSMYDMANIKKLRLLGEGASAAWEGYKQFDKAAMAYSRSADPMIRLYSTPWGGLLAWTLPYLPVRLQRIALGNMYGGTDRVLDRCLHEIVHCLRNPGTLRHVLCILRCWFTEMAKLGFAIRRIRRTPILLVWGDADLTVSLRSGIKLHRRLRSDLVIVPGCGHAVFQEMPEEANRTVLEWLARHPLNSETNRQGRQTHVPKPALRRLSTTQVIQPGD